MKHIPVCLGRVVVCLMASALALAGCSGSSYDLAMEASAPMEAPGDAPAEPFASRNAAKTFDVSLAQDASELPASPAVAGAVLNLVQGATPVQPYLVKNVDIAVQVEDVTKQSAALQELAIELGGYLAELNERSTQLSGGHVQMTLRIPADRLNDAMEQIGQLGTVLHRNLGTDDVTLQYVDMQSRLRNLEKMETRLLAHLDRTGTMEDILGVERELSRVRGESEQLQGRINDLSNQISFATVRAELSAVPTAGPINPASAFSTSRTFANAVRNLLLFARVLWTVTIWILVWAPVWAPLALLARYVYRRQQEAIGAEQSSPAPPE